MVGAIEAGKKIAIELINVTNLFYQKKTQLRFLYAMKNVISDKIEQLEKEEQKVVV